jgi:hypothetical protein
VTICKKHGKERNRIVTTKRGRGGTPFEYVGCEDCAAGLPAKDAAATPPPGIKKDTKKSKLSEKEPAKPKAEEPKKVRSIGERFGFKF